MDADQPGHSTTAVPATPPPPPPLPPPTGRNSAAAQLETPPTVELTVDEIIEGHVGSFGLSQLVHVLLLSVARVFDSQVTLVTIFSDAQPAWKCKGGAAGAVCRAATGGTTSEAAGMCGLPPGSWEWVGGSKSSTITEWGLVCGHKFEAGAPASLFFIGCILGSFVHGRLADLYLGRKKAVILTCFLTSITCFLISFSPNIWVYAILRFFSGFSRAGIGICSLVLATEAVGRRWRGQVGQYGFFFFTMGFLILPLIAYPLRTSWRNLYRVISLPPFIYSLVVLPFVSESPRWLAVKGRTSEAMMVLNRFATGKGKKIPPNVIISSAACCPTTTGGSGGAGQNGSMNPNLWKKRWAAKRMIMVMFTGFGIGFVYYGIQLNVENLSFSLYFAVAVNALMEIPAVVLGGVFISFMKRRILFSVAALIAGTSCLLCIIFTNKSRSVKSKHSWAQLATEAIGFMASSMAYNALYIHCVEMFPTNVRNFAVSMLRQSTMLGAAIAPLLVVLGRVSPALLFIVFGGFAFFSAAMTFWLPETMDAPLFETLEQQEKEEKLGLNPNSHSNLESQLSTL